MSILYGQWSVEDVRDVLRGLDEKTGMDGASIHISLCKTLGNGLTLGTYHPGSDNSRRHFSFSLQYFNNVKFKDLAAVDVIRHEYCHYLVDALNLKSVFNDKDAHGIAWKTVCGLLNTDQYGTYRAWYFKRTSESSLLNALLSNDIQTIDILEQIGRWGCRLPSINRRKYLEKELIKKYTKARVFAVNNRVIHSKFGMGTVLDTLPFENKQLLYVAFDDGEPHIVQNRHVYKMVNGQVKKPTSKAR